MKTRKNIGFMTFWGYNKGLPKLAMNYIKMLKDDFNIFLLKQGTNPIGPAFKAVSDVIDIQEYDGSEVDTETFKKWVLDNKLDAVVFNEYNQWTIQEDNLVEYARELGVKTFGILVLERFDPLSAVEYDRILAPTRSFMRLMRNIKIRNAVYSFFSLDTSLYTPVYLNGDEEEFKFIHVAGTGGVLNRKNTQVVIEAFKLLDDERATLTITSQKKLPFEEEHPRIKYLYGDFGEEEFYDMIANSHVSVNPSKWETIGIPILESLALGTPVITNDIPPMNEFVRPGVSGYLCRIKSAEYEGISIEAAEVEPSELKIRMKSIMQPALYNMLARNSRAIVERDYDLQKNKSDLIRIFEEELL